MATERAGGMTLKQSAIAEFWAALDAYKAALQTGKGIIGASLRIHRAKGSVSKRYRAIVGRVFREAQRV